MNLFIDTNIFLSFFYLTSDDLEELKKLIVLLERGKVSLFITDQVKQEFERNREIKIVGTLKKLNNQNLRLEFPQLCKDYPEYVIMRALQRNYEEQHAILISQINKDITGRALKADNIISELFQKAKCESTTKTLIEKARLRIDIGNPPGKKGSLGDAINWEILLKHITNGQDLHFVTRDKKDFVSVLDESSLRGFLLKEWSDKKNSHIIYYNSLSSFFKEHFPHISLASELEKELLIGELFVSSSFSQTHSVVAKLSMYDDFTAVQRNNIVNIAISNNQIYLIAEDDDVNKFLRSVIKGHEDKIKPESLHMLGFFLEKPKSDLKSSENVPF